MRSPVVVALVAAVLLIVAPSASATPPSADGVRAYAYDVALAWQGHQLAGGAVADPLRGGAGLSNYGTLLLADVQIRAAADRNDAAAAARAAEIPAAAAAHSVPSDPFNLFAGAAVQGTLAVHGELGLNLGPWVGDMARQGPAAAGGCLAVAWCYNNWRLVWAAGAAQALTVSDTGLSDDDVSALRGQIAAAVRMAAENAGPVIRAAGRPARVLADPESPTPAYHVFSAYMLERVYAAAPWAFDAAALRLREHVGAYALALMAPDGQLAAYGRSLEQSWVLAAAAALGARRVQAGGPDAAMWARFSDRALNRLQRLHPRMADGTLPIVPALRWRPDPAIMDGYASMPQYNGLTVWLLADAAAYWPSASAPRAALPADRPGMLADDLAGSGLIWGRSDDVWWMIAGRSTGRDPRYDQGIVAVKTREAGAWVDQLAARPRSDGSDGRSAGAWRLRAGGRLNSLKLDAAAGTGRRIKLSGRWIPDRPARGRAPRAAVWDLVARHGRLNVDVDVAAGQEIAATFWLPSRLARGIGAEGTRGRVRWGTCRWAASGLACPRRVTWSGPGVGLLTIGAAGRAQSAAPAAEGQRPFGRVCGTLRCDPVSPAVYVLSASASARLLRGLQLLRR